MATQRESTGFDPGSKSAAEIEREVQESRADVERTLDQIQERLSPGQLLDQAVGYLRGGGGDFARNLGDSIRNNPLPVTLMGVGLAWMMLSDRTRDGGRSQRPEWEGDWERDLDDRDLDDDLAYDPYAESEYAAAALYEETAVGPGFGAAPASGPGIGERLSEAGDRVAGLGERAKEASASARERAEALGAEAGERLGDAGRHMRHAGARLRRRAERTGRSARHYGRRARESAFQALSEHPLVLGAVGLAVGAALGGALPPSEAEDKLMGKASDRLQRRAAEAGREQLAKAREAAGAAYDAAREEAEAQGLTPEAARDAAREAARSTADKVGKVASAARSAAEEEIRSGDSPSDRRPS